MTLQTTGAGLLRPKARTVLNDGTMDRIRVTCPGIRVDGSEPAPALNAKLDAVWGAMISLRRATAPESDGSADGLAGALARHLVESGQVESVIMADDFESGPRPGTLTRLRQRLAEGASFAVFGRPCDIAALRNLAHLDNRVDRLAVLTVSHFCRGLTMTGEAATAESKAPLQFRCQICPDNSGAQADVVVGLAGKGAIADSNLDHDSRPDLGLPLVGRSLRGEAVIRVAESDGVLASVPLSLPELARSRGELQDRKQDLWAKLVALVFSRRQRPRYRNSQIWAAGRRISWERKWRVFRAMRQALKAAGVLEPP